MSASRACSLSMSHSINNPGCNSRRMSAGRTHSGSFRTSKYAWRMHATCLDSGRARDSGFRSSAAVPCTRTKVLAESEVSRRERSLLSSAPSGCEGFTHTGKESATIVYCFAPRRGRGLRKANSKRQMMLLRCGSVVTTRSLRSRTRELRVAIIS
jgi:hypothetical protein